MLTDSDIEYFTERRTIPMLISTYNHTLRKYKLKRILHDTL